MSINIESERAHAFVQHLYSNPSLQRYTPLQREEQIGQFLEQNSHTLLPTLSSSNFFPGYQWEQIVELVLSLVREKTDRLFAVDARELLSHRINFNFLKEYNTPTINYDQVQEQFLWIIDDIMKNQVARRSFSGNYVAALYNVSARYLQLSLSRKRYVHFELRKVQKLQLSLEHLCDVIKVMLLLMPAVWMFVEKELSNSDVAGNMRTLSTTVAENAIVYLKENLNLIPESISRSAVYANFSFLDNSDIDATSRIAAIFSARCKNYHPEIKVDRGAESADKSWIYIAKRNYKFYGFDSKMLEEFYGIASEERW